jgi:hypothetical protein
MAISNAILSSTLRILLDEEVDNLFKATPLLSQLKKKGQIDLFDGGQKLSVPLILADHSSITQLSTGYEPVNLAVADSLRNANFEWCDFVAPIVITEKEELSNKGERAIVSIAEARMKSVMGMLQREFEKQVIAGTSTVLTELNTLQGANTTNGFLEHEAFGSQTNSVGGISKAAFPNDFQNQVVQCAAGFGGGAGTGIANLTDLYIACQNRTPNAGAPDLILASPTMYSLYKGLLYNNERFIGEDTLDGGRLALAFHGAQMYVDPFLPAGAAAPSTQAVSGYALNTDYLRLAMDTDANFKMSDFETISGYCARSAKIYVRCQLYAQHLASQGLICNAEA